MNLLFEIYLIHSRIMLFRISLILCGQYDMGNCLEIHCGKVIQRSNFSKAQIVFEKAHALKCLIQPSLNRDELGSLSPPVDNPPYDPCSRNRLTVLAIGSPFSRSAHRSRLIVKGSHHEHRQQPHHHGAHLNTA